MKDILDNKDYEIILQNMLKSNKVKFVEAKWAQFSENVEGYLGEHYILKLTYKNGETEGTECFFIKTKPRSLRVQKDVINSMNFYGKEIFLYDYLFKEYEKCRFNMGFAPFGYYCKNGETIVMEDLQSAGFKTVGKKTYYDIEHCKISLNSVANYHANSIAFEELKSKEIGKKFNLQGKFGVFDDKLLKNDSVWRKFRNLSEITMINTSKLLDNSEEWKKDFEDRMTKYDFTKVFNQDLPCRKCVTHGDLWSNNILFKYDNEGVPTECKLVDYQILRYHYPSYDIGVLIHSNCSRDFKKKHLDYLLNYYYTTLGHILKNYGLDIKNILTWDNFLKSYRALEPVAVRQSVAVRTFTYLPTDVLNNFVNSEGNASSDLIFQDRTKLVEETFKNDEFCRKIFTEDILEIYEQICREN